MNSRNRVILRLPNMFKRSISALFTGVGLLLLVILSGCEGKEEGIPAYLEINSISLSTNPVTEGTNSNKITDAWVYMDGGLVGVFELPCKFPVLAEGTHDFMIKAGIKMNGITNSRAYYPFYQPIEQQLNLVPGETITLTPTVTYYPDKVHYKETFEDGGISFEALGTSDTGLLKTSEAGMVFEGAYSGVMRLNADVTHIFVGTINAFDLPTSGTPVFLEMNYKIDNPMAIGLLAIRSGESEKNEIITLNANEAWNKIYINLTACANANAYAEEFKLYFEVYKEENLTAATLLFDNLKLLWNE